VQKHGRAAAEDFNKGKILLDSGKGKRAGGESTGMPVGAARKAGGNHAYMMKNHEVSQKQRVGGRGGGVKKM